MKRNSIIVALLSAVFISGCQSAPTHQEGKESVQTFDNYGNVVEVSDVPKKVLTLGPNCTELLIALGLQDKIIGTSLSNHSRGPLAEYQEAYEQIPQLTHASATREAVLSSGADFIYGIDWEFGQEALDIEELANFGITTYKNSATTLEQIYQEITDLGKIFHIEETAQAFIQDQKNRIAQVETLVASQAPLNVLVYDSGGNGVFTCSGTNFETLLIEKAGGKNIFDDLQGGQWVTVSSEEVLYRQPDVILIHDYDTPSLAEKIKEIKADPALAQLDCVKQERFIAIPLESVLPGDRMAYTVEHIAKGLYPSLF